MDRIEPLRPVYRDLLARFLMASDAMERELAMMDATELARQCLGDGPALDQMIELHTHSQATLADGWRAAAAGSPEHAGRERMTRGDATPMMVALTLPHELAQRAHHERRWRREHETLTAMVEQTDDLIVILDADGELDDVNPAFCRVTGWTRMEAVSGAVDWKTWLGALGPQGRIELPRRDGSRFASEWSISQIVGQNGQLISKVCIGRDVTRREQIESGLRENDKLRAVATLAAGIAHDFNNLLGSVLGLAELCELEAVAGSRQARNLTHIRLAAGKAATLVRQMLDFSRQTPKTLQELSGSELVAHAAVLLRTGLPPGLGLQVEVLDDATVAVDLVQMEQVLLNMVRNAAHAMRGRAGVVRIGVDRVQAGPDAGGVTLLRLRIADTGEGMPPEVVSKIFEPFFTTKPVGEGTGLGLAAAHGIVSNHGGTIEVASTPGVGTTFSILLPCTAPAQVAGGGADMEKTSLPAVQPEP